MRRDFADPFSALNKGAGVADLDEFERDFSDNPIEPDPTIEADREDEDPITDDTTTPEEGESKKIEDPEYDVEITGNPIFIIAKKWKEEGKLPDDFEVSEDITEEAFDEAFYTYKEKVTKDNLKAQIFDELMESEGLTPEAIQSAKLFHFGVGQEELRTLNVYQSLASLELDPDSDDYEKNFRDFGTAFYIDKGFTEEQAIRYVTRDYQDSEDDSIINEYKNHFKNSAVKLKTDIETKAETNRLNSILERESKIAFVNTALDKGEIDGVKYSKTQIETIKKALFQKTEMIKDPNGTVRMVTLEQKKILESKNNPEKRLKARIDFILGPESAKTEDAVIKATKSITSGLKSIVSVKPKTDRPADTPARKYEFEKEL